MHETPFDEFLDTLSPQSREAVMKAYIHYENEFLALIKEYGAQEAINHAHQFMDERIADEMKTRTKQPVTCKAGCNFCCRIYVECSEHEAKRMLPYLHKEDISEIKRQAQYTQDTWEQQPYAQRKCVFLKNNLCSAYPVRPGACRKWLVASVPELCNTEIHPAGRVLVSSVLDAELMTGAIMNCDNTGAMAKQIAKYF